ncbi:MAG: hypothetical protein ACFFDN_42660 [Candidatus Hodarchaeota archaeon]
MTKRKKGRVPSTKIKHIYEESGKTEDGEIGINATLGPDSSLEQPTQDYLKLRDSTNEPEAEEERETDNVLAESQWGLIEKYIIRKNILPFAVAVVGISFIFIQDNGAGKLDNWEAIQWTITKCGVFLGINLIILFLMWLYKKIFGK